MATVNRPRPSGTWGRRLRSERGQALIEMALTLPLLLLICVGIFEFGRAYQTWEVLTNAAREGARVAGTAEREDPPQSMRGFASTSRWAGWSLTRACSLT